MKKYDLFGDCHRFVADMAEKEEFKSTKIQCLVIPRMCILIHAYFKDANGNLIDSRGDFENESDFFAPFTMTEAKKKYSETLEFESVSEFKKYIISLIGESVTETDEDGNELKVSTF